VPENVVLFLLIFAPTAKSKLSFLLFSNVTLKLVLLVLVCTFVVPQRDKVQKSGAAIGIVSLN